MVLWTRICKAPVMNGRGLVVRRPRGQPMVRYRQPLNVDYARLGDLSHIFRFKNQIEPRR